MAGQQPAGMRKLPVTKSTAGVTRRCTEGFQRERNKCTPRGGSFGRSPHVKAESSASGLPNAEAAPHALSPAARAVLLPVCNMDLSSIDLMSSQLQETSSTWSWEARNKLRVNSFEAASEGSETVRKTDWPSHLRMHPLYDKLEVEPLKSSVASQPAQRRRPLSRL